MHEGIGPLRASAVLPPVLTGGSTSTGGAAVKQIQVTRTRRRPAQAEVDTRTPSGRVLPF